MLSPLARDQLILPSGQLKIIEQDRRASSNFQKYQPESTIISAQNRMQIDPLIHSKQSTDTLYTWISGTMGTQLPNTHRHTTCHAPGVITVNPNQHTIVNYSNVWITFSFMTQIYAVADILSTNERSRNMGVKSRLANGCCAFKQKLHNYL